MKRLSNNELKSSFLAWQCRLRQMAMRDHGGTPMPGFRPRVSSLKGEILMPEMTILLVPEQPEESIAFFKFQLQKTSDHRQAFEAGLKYLAADFYQLPELFSDEITAVFAKGSILAHERGLRLQPINAMARSILVSRAICRGAFTSTRKDAVACSHANMLSRCWSGMRHTLLYSTRNLTQALATQMEARSHRKDE